MNPKTAEALSTLARHSAPADAKQRALRALVMTPDVEAVVPLVALLPEIEPALAPELRLLAIRLGAAGLLTARLEAQAPERRVETLRLLGFLADPAALPVLERELAHPVARVRELAVNALIPLRTPRVRPALERLLEEDPDPGVRMAAAQGLGELADEPSCAALARALTAERDGFARVVVELAAARADRLRARAVRRDPAGARVAGLRDVGVRWGA
jgi:HEAT repeat protein